MTVFDLTKKVAIVTGGGTGIGKGIAKELAKAGANVVIASRKIDVIEKASAEIKALGVDSISVQTDVTIKEQADNLMKITLNKFGRIDILVNNAGGSAPWQFEKISPAGWDLIMGINLKGAFLCSQAVGDIMKTQKSGKIINISSIAALNGSPGIAHYGAAKAGVINLTKSLAALWGRYGVHVNCIIPGFIKTEVAQTVLGVTDEQMNQAMKAFPIPRVGLPEEIGYTAVFLASKASDYMTGQTMIIDGGLSLGKSE